MSGQTACSCGCGALGPKPLPLAEVCRALEQNERTLRRWVGAGCPHHKGPGRTGALTFDQVEVVAWMRELGRTGQPGRPPAEVTLLGPAGAHPPGGSAAPAPGPRASAHPPPRDGDEEKDKPPTREELLHLTAVANLRIKELEAQKRARQEREAEGELHDVAACRARSIARINAVKAVFQILPGKLAERCAMKPYDEVYQVLSEELDAVLRGFAGRS